MKVMKIQNVYFGHLLGKILLPSPPTTLSGPLYFVPKANLHNSTLDIEDVVYCDKMILHQNDKNEC